MKHVFLGAFVRQLEKFPLAVQKKFHKQLHYLIKDVRHPSLRAKKYDETSGVWQARVDQEVRFYFTIDGEMYILMDIKKHPK